MRILYIDIDSLRLDHLGCYGYRRDTSPNIDQVADGAVRFTNCYTPDAPCLPSRTAMALGRFGIHTGVVNHGGTSSDVYSVGPTRGFRSPLSQTSWPTHLAQCGYYTASISPFPERHSAWQVLAGFREWYNPGKGGMETADEVWPYLDDWLGRNADRDNWFLHLNVWDPHTPYRTPEKFGNPFEGEPYDDWLTQELLDEHYASFGPHSAHDQPANIARGDFSRMPGEIRTLGDFRRWIDGYDVGVKYADDYVGRALNLLADQGVLDDTAIIITADHGENLGERNVYGDHQTADYVTSRIPMIVKWPGIEGRVDDRLIYNVDMAAAVVEQVGGKVPNHEDARPAMGRIQPWDGEARYVQLADGGDPEREAIVVSQMAWSCERCVRWGDWALIRTYHPGWKDFPPISLFNIADDPHMTNNLADTRPEIVDAGLAKLERWHTEQMLKSRHEVDPLWNVMREGGPWHTNNPKENAAYLEDLRGSGRGHHADALAERYRDRIG